MTLQLVALDYPEVHQHTGRILDDHRHNKSAAGMIGVLCEHADGLSFPAMSATLTVRSGCFSSRPRNLLERTLKKRLRTDARSLSFRPWEGMGGYCNLARRLTPK